MSDNTTFYIWQGCGCHLVRLPDGSAMAEVYRTNEFVSENAYQIERDGIPVSEERYRETIRQQIVASLPRESLQTQPPVVRIWAPDAQKFPSEHNAMQTLSRHRDFLTAIFQFQGIATVDVMPPLPSGTWVPAFDDPDAKYELIPDLETGSLGREKMAVLRDFIHEGLDFLGYAMEPQTDKQRTEYVVKQRLTLLKGDAG